MTLRCSKCGKTKSDEAFPGDNANPGRRFRHRWCRPCVARSCKAYSVRKRYGLSLDEYERLLKSGCSVCGRKDGKLVMDHCHFSETNRGVLCNACNVSLGMAGDDPQRLRDLAVYLETHQRVE